MKKIDLIALDLDGTALNPQNQVSPATADAVRKAGLRVVSLYIGGGTPTTLSARQLDALCTQLAAAFDLSALREFTVEAGRPDTITADKLQVLRAHRVDRISVNPQTLDDRVLDTIGRRHTAQDIYDALRLVRETGGFAVNMDLIAGLPGDTPDGFRATLEQVLALAPENITVHTLSRKRGSNLMAQDAPIPDGAAVGEMLDFAGTVLPRAGYAPYYLYRQKFMSGGFENVGWTRPGQENLYNICIMEELCSILAMGGGAYYITMPKMFKVNLTGTLRPFVTAKDISLELLRILSVKGGVGAIIEWGGPGIAALSVPERATITNMGTELGATTSIFPSDAVTRAFLAAEGRAADFTPLQSDPDAHYDRVIDIDLDKLQPMIACPHSPDNVVPVASLAGTKVDQVCIGSRIRPCSICSRSRRCCAARPSPRA